MKAFTPPVTYRSATSADAGRIAALHARSWRENYVADMSARYLAEQAPTERLELWTKRFTENPRNMRCILAMADEELLGFSCWFLDHSSRDGTLLDNLHVSAHRRGSGIGKTLMARGAHLALTEATDDRIYLWVLASNTSAQQVYRHLGGIMGRSKHQRLPGTEGEGAPAICVHFRAQDLSTRT